MSSFKRIVITGATRGLGLAMAEAFIASGHVVAGCGRSVETIEQLRKAHPAPHAWFAVDVTDTDAVDNWAKDVLDSLGPPDLLVNNAALINRTAPLWDVTAAEFSKVIDVNIKGVHHVIRAFVPAMIEAGTGVIVNFSSGWGRSTSPEVAPYCATKFAMEGLTQALSQELPSGLAAVALNPGIIDTDMLRSCWAEGASSYPPPRQWVTRAAPMILKLGPRDNGKSLSV